MGVERGMCVCVEREMCVWIGVCVYIGGWVRDVEHRGRGKKKKMI